MNFISKIPQSLLVAVLATVGFILTDYVTSGLYHVAPLPWPEFIIFLFVMSLSGIVAAIVVWLGMRKVVKNAWAIAIITGFAMFGSFTMLDALMSVWLGYIALLLVSWALIVATTHIFSTDRYTALKFSGLFMLCAVFWYAARLLAWSLIVMRVQ
ncbi:MAG TPA: hypothetical protein VJ841_05410 [Candidatus Saccharimonadales bacterium]|nr:hypothetical protein [Candidatus Saccharimonadales bacterium]